MANILSHQVATGCDGKLGGSEQDSASNQQSSPGKLFASPLMCQATHVKVTAEQRGGGNGKRSCARKPLEAPETQPPCLPSLFSQALLPSHAGKEALLLKHVSCEGNPSSQVPQGSRHKFTSFRLLNSSLPF